MEETHILGNRKLVQEIQRQVPQQQSLHQRLFSRAGQDLFHLQISALAFVSILILFTNAVYLFCTVNSFAITASWIS